MGRPKGRKTKIVKKIKIGEKVFPVSETQFKRVQALLHPTKAQRLRAIRDLRKLGLNI